MKYSEYALKNMNVVTIENTISAVSDSLTAPTATVKLYPDMSLRVHLKTSSPLDQVKFLPPFKLKVQDIKVKNITAVANGGVIIYNGTSVMHAELAAIVKNTLARATVISDGPAEVETTEYIKVVGVSTGQEFIVVFDVIQA